MACINKNLEQILILLNKEEVSKSKEERKLLLESALLLTNYIQDSYQRKNYTEHITKKLDLLK